MAVRVQLPEGPVKVDPGRAAEVKVGLTSSGGVVDSFRLDVLGDPGGWSEFEPSIIKILPNTQREAKLTFRPKPDTAPGAHPFAVRAVSTEGQGMVVEEGVVQVAVTDDITLDLHPRTAFASKRTKQQLQVINTGNAPVTVQLRATDPDGRAELDVHPEMLNVAPGTVGLATVRGRLPRGLDNNERCRYKIEALNEDGNVERLDSELVYRSRGLLKWIAIVVIILLVIAIALVVRNRGRYDSGARERSGGPLVAGGPKGNGDADGPAGGTGKGGADGKPGPDGTPNQAPAGGGDILKPNGGGGAGQASQQPTARLVWIQNGELWAQMLPSGRAQPLTGTPENEAEPDLSPDGNAVVYVRANRIAYHRFNTENHGLSELPENSGFVNKADKPGNVHRPRFSADGKYITFLRIVGETTEIVAAVVGKYNEDRTVARLGSPRSNGDPHIGLSVDEWFVRENGVPIRARYSETLYEKQPLTRTQVTEMSLSRDAKTLYVVIGGVVHQMPAAGGRPSPMPGSSGDRQPRNCQDGRVVVTRGKDIVLLDGNTATVTGLKGDAATC